MRYWSIFRHAFILLLYSAPSIAQVDDYRMRHEQSLAQLKPQELALIGQKTYIFSTDYIQQIHRNIRDIVRYQTTIYTLDHSPYSSEWYYQNKKVNPSIWIQNVEFQTDVLAHNTDMISNLPCSGIGAVQLGQGYAPSHYTMQGGQLGLNYTIEPNPQDSADSKLVVGASGSNIDYQFFLQYRLHKSRWNYLAQLYAGQQYATRLGHSGGHPSWLSWNRIARPYNGNGSWTTPQDSMVNNQKQVYLGTTHIWQYKLANKNEWNIYFHLAGRSENLLGRTIQRGNEYLYSQSELNIAPQIQAFIQKVKYSSQSPFYSQLHIALTYQHIHAERTERLDIQDEPTRRYNEENKIALQLRAYKDINAREVVYYGMEGSSNFLKTNFHNSDSFLHRVDAPIARIHGYWRYERRQSSDISWLFGLKGGIMSSRMKYLPFSEDKQLVIRGSAELNLAWLRHICESSNYGIHLFLRSRAPYLSEFHALHQPITVVPNSNLSNETELLIESHLYRKFDDKLEIQWSPYYRYTWRPIALKDYYGNMNTMFSYGSRSYFIQHYTNTTPISEGGFSLEFKYNFTKKWLAYHHISLQQVWSQMDSTIFYPRLPIYGSLGIKHKTKKIYLHAWMYSNLGSQYSNMHPSQYIRFYAQRSGQQREFPSYFTLHFHMQYALARTISIQLYLDNILDQFALDDLSTMPQLGRRMGLGFRLHW